MILHKNNLRRILPYDKRLVYIKGLVCLLFRHITTIRHFRYDYLCSLCVGHIGIGINIIRTHLNGKNMIISILSELLSKSYLNSLLYDLSPQPVCRMPNPFN